MIVYLANKTQFREDIISNRIVKRVEALMTTCLALEAEIEHARTHVAQLLQAVLKEAFVPGGA